MIIYVDDILITGRNKYLVAKVKKFMKFHFQMEDYGCMHQFMRMKITQLTTSILVTQNKYASNMLKCFGLEGCACQNTSVGWNKSLGAHSTNQYENRPLFHEVYDGMLNVFN